jgi:hypothetical protein
MFCHSHDNEIYADTMGLVCRHNERANSYRIFVNDHLENTTILLYQNTFWGGEMDVTGSGSHPVMGFCRLLAVLSHRDLLPLEDYF